MSLVVAWRAAGRGRGPLRVSLRAASPGPQCRGDDWFVGNHAGLELTLIGQADLGTDPLEVVHVVELDHNATGTFLFT